MGRPLTSEWREWLRLNRGRGCDPLELLGRARAHGFDAEAIVHELGTPELLLDPKAIWCEPPVLDPGHLPRAWKLDTPLAQVFEIPGLLSREECARLMAAIDQALVPSTVTFGPNDYRTSQTCHLGQAAPALVRDLDLRFAALFGVHPDQAESLQGQRYAPGQYFKAHTDWFEPDTAEFEEHCRVGGQRTWTLMVYLNTVELGGETVFPLLGRAFTPVACLALVWNNLHPDGSPNHTTLHEALPVLQGRKYVITKWFRQHPLPPQALGKAD